MQDGLHMHIQACLLQKAAVAMGHQRQQLWDGSSSGYPACPLKATTAAQQ
jgi:hypothetical protein